MWEDLKPVVKTVPRIKASISVLQTGVAKINIGVSDMIHRYYKEFTRCHVQCGTDENAGMVRFSKFDGSQDEAAFALTPGGTGGGRMIMPLVEGVPRIDAESYACEIIKQEPDELIFKLPLAEWKKEQDEQARKPAADLRDNGTARPQVQKLPEPEPEPQRHGLTAVATGQTYNRTVEADEVDKNPPKVIGSKLVVDAVKYLEAKGIKAKRDTASGGFVIDGRVVPKHEALRHINQFREKAGVYLLGLGHIG